MVSPPFPLSAVQSVPLGGGITPEICLSHQESSFPHILVIMTKAIQSGTNRQAAKAGAFKIVTVIRKVGQFLLRDLTFKVYKVSQQKYSTPNDHLSNARKDFESGCYCIPFPPYLHFPFLPHHIIVLCRDAAQGLQEPQLGG